jgi:hypothetical protein
VKSLDDVCCASFPAGALGALGPLRCWPGVRVLEQGDRCWLWWEPSDAEVLRAVLPIDGVQLFARRDGLWYRAGEALPVFTLPGSEGARSLTVALTPASLQPDGSAAPAVAPVALRLVRGEELWPTSALLCPALELRTWADTATSHELAQVRGASWGTQVLLVGAPLPAVASGERFWGERVLIPLGYRPEPDLAESVLVSLLGLQSGELALFRPGGVTVLPDDALELLTRAALRLIICPELFSPSPARGEGRGGG